MPLDAGKLLVDGLYYSRIEHCKKLEKSRIQKVGLLGTKYTMTQDFYKKRLIDRGIDVMIPEVIHFTARTESVEKLKKVVRDQAGVRDYKVYEEEDSLTIGICPMGDILPQKPGGQGIQ